MQRILYNFSIQCYGLLIASASLFDKKAKKRYLGDYHFKSIVFKKTESKLIWFHCSSLGEFEQARPVIEALKERHPAIQLLISFFSPSGYEPRKKYALADYVTYMPLDTIENATDFVNHFKPDVAIFMKYDFWPTFLMELKNQHIPVISLGTKLKSGSFILKARFLYLQEAVKAIKLFVTQDVESEKLLRKAGFTNVKLGGDTRFDRVAQLSQSLFDDALITDFVSNATLTIVLGSCYEPEESFVLPILSKYPNVKFVLVPHDIHSSHKALWREKGGNQIAFYTQAEANGTLAEKQILYVDTIGLLGKLYRIGDICMVGGAFSNKVHNVLEAAVYGKPVLVGSNHADYPEVAKLIKAGGAAEIKSRKQGVALISKLIEHPSNREKMGERAAHFVREKTGATLRSIELIEPFL